MYVRTVSRNYGRHCELSTFLVRQYGLANEQYIEYATDRLSLSGQGAQSLMVVGLGLLLSGTFIV